MGTIPYNYGNAKIGGVPYLEQTQSPLRFSPQLNTLMENMYGAGATGLATLAYSQQEQDPLVNYANNKTRSLSTQKYTAPTIGNIKNRAIPNASFSSMNFDPIEQQARSGFESTTIPTIAERFTSMGSGASGSAAFARTLGSAGSELESNLASMKAQLLPQWEMQQAQYGLQRSALEQQQDQMQLQRNLSQAQLDAQYDSMNQNASLANLQNLQNWTLQQQSNQQQQQQLRTQQLLGLLGFSPPQTWGASSVKQVPNPTAPGSDARTSSGLPINSIGVPVNQNNPWAVTGGLQTMTTLSRLAPTEAMGMLQNLGYQVPQKYLGPSSASAFFNLN